MQTVKYVSYDIFDVKDQHNFLLLSI